MNTFVKVSNRLPKKMQKQGGSGNDCNIKFDNPYYICCNDKNKKNILNYFQKSFCTNLLNNW